MELHNRRYRFQKKEKLCSEKEIAELFENGKWEHRGSLRTRYLLNSAKEFILPQILISVPKKQIRKAVMRNRIKRQIREAYRLNKEELVNLLMENPYELRIAFIYSGKSGTAYSTIEKDIKDCLRLIIKKIKPAGV